MSTQLFTARFLERAAVANVKVPCEHIVKLKQYYDLLRRWNRQLNLTALRLDGYPPAALDRLLLEPLVTVPFLEDVAGEWVDLGSGGGSPAIPLKIVRPGLPLLMTESRERKAAFLRETVRQIGLEHTVVFADRFEGLADQLAGSVGLVTIRAVKIDRNVCDFVTHVLRPAGRLLIFGVSPSALLDNFELTHSGPLPGVASRFTLLTKP